MDLEKDQKMWMKSLARNSSVGCSSRTSYYYGSDEGVPFQWEMKPGIAIHNPQLESQLILPLSPPPAILSLTLPKPNSMHLLHDPRVSTTWSTRRRCRLWKKITRKLTGKLEGGKKLQEMSSHDDAKDFDVFERFLECNYSDFESLSSPCEISSSSSSSSSLCRPSMKSIRSESPSREIYGRPLSCIPIHFSRNLISIVKRD